MFIDYLTLMLINMAAGLALLALFVFKYLDAERKKLAPGFLASGLLSFLTGLHVILTWPLPGSYNIPFGEMATFFGILFLIGGFALLFDWDLLSLGIYAIFVGAASIELGIRVYALGMTSEPLVASGGFILTGLMAVLTLPVYYLRRFVVIRCLAALGLVGSAAIWLVTGLLAYWAHLQAFSKWAPLFMQGAK
ncbi:MAG TPA: DUF981 domain-containing protein [Rectinemataceae bacterium]|nr:DUF981 domain-containing protein [Rectinemataceae bacterium]